MNKLTGVFAALVLFCTSGSVIAAGNYVLTEVGAWNTYTTGFSDPVVPFTFPPIPYAGSATVDGGGAFTATGVQFGFINAGSTFNYTNGSWSGVVGGAWWPIRKLVCRTSVRSARVLPVV